MCASHWMAVKKHKNVTMKRDGKHRKQYKVGDWVNPWTHPRSCTSIGFTAKLALVYNSSETANEVIGIWDDFWWGDECSLHKVLRWLQWTLVSWVEKRISGQKIILKSSLEVLEKWALWLRTLKARAAPHPWYVTGNDGFGGTCAV